MKIKFPRFAVATSVFTVLAFLSDPARAITYDFSATNLDGQTLIGTIQGDLSVNSITSVNLVDSALASPLTQVLGFGTAQTADLSGFVTFGFSNDPAATLASYLAAITSR